MHFQLFHFHGSDKILEQKIMVCDVAMTVEHVFNALNGRQPSDPLVRVALGEMGWHKENTNLGAEHNCRFEGLKNGVGLEVCLDAYGSLVQGLVNLQMAFDQGQIDVGILLLSARGIPERDSENLKIVLTRDMDALASIISLPVTVSLYDLGECKPDHAPSYLCHRKTA